MRKFLEKLFPSLGKKVAFAFIITFFVAGSTFVYFAHQTGYIMLEKGAQTKAHSIAEFGKAILEDIMMSGKSAQLHSVLERIVASNQASDILILNQNGTIALGAKHKEEIEKLPLERFSVIPQYPDDKFLFVNEGGSLFEYVITPIIKQPGCYRCHTEPEATKGFLAVKLSMDDVRGVALEHRTVNILMTAITFAGLGGVLFTALLFLVIRPVRKLQDQIKQVETQLKQFERGGEVIFSELAIPNQQDEISIVMKSFNNLIRRLNEANAKVHELHHSRMEHADRLASAGEMAAGIAHEIKNPIAGVLGALQVFDDETPANHDRKEIFTEMIAQLERVNHAINDLLSYARPTPPVFEQSNLNDLIKRTISLLSQQIKQKRVEISTDFIRDEIKIAADKKQLQQVIWNILLNAVQAIEQEGKVNISLVDENSSILIQVIDTGKGITLEQLSHVFQPFYTTKHKGTGLGMTISKRIVEQHRGTITINSTSGKGTIVTIMLPKEQKK